MTVASGQPGCWQVSAPQPVGDVASLFARLRRAGDPVVLGVDFPLGLPRAFARQLAAPGFPAFLRALAEQPGFFSVCDNLAEVRPERPFYPRRGTKGMTRLAHAAALGLDDAAGLSRWCDEATAERPAGAPLFWTLGANQSGKAAIAAWKDLLLPALAAELPPLLWPFDGPLRRLVLPGRVVVAETYPAEAMRQLGLRMGGSKRRQADRVRLAPGLAAAMSGRGAAAETGLANALEDGFGADAAGEDRFDSLLGLLCVLGVLNGARPDTSPPDEWVQRWEGWVLGQTALPHTQRFSPARFRDTAGGAKSSSLPAGRAPGRGQDGHHLGGAKG